MTESISRTTNEDSSEASKAAHIRITYDTIMALAKSDIPHEKGNDDGQYTTIDAYVKCDTHMDEASGYLDFEDFPNEQNNCGECGMVARNEERKITCNPFTRDNYPAHALITS